MKVDVLKICDGIFLHVLSIDDKFLKRNLSILSHILNNECGGFGVSEQAVSEIAVINIQDNDNWVEKFKSIIIDWIDGNLNNDSLAVLSYNDNIVKYFNSAYVNDIYAEDYDINISVSLVLKNGYHGIKKIKFQDLFDYEIGFITGFKENNPVIDLITKYSDELIGIGFAINDYYEDGRYENYSIAIIK